jgi:hypothetical protein
MRYESRRDAARQEQQQEKEKHRIRKRKGELHFMEDLGFTSDDPCIRVTDEGKREYLQTLSEFRHDVSSVLDILFECISAACYPHSISVACVMCVRRFCRFPFLIPFHHEIPVHSIAHSVKSILLCYEYFHPVPEPIVRKQETNQIFCSIPCYVWQFDHTVSFQSSLFPSE